MKDPFKLYNEHIQKIREEYPILHHYGDIWAMEIYRQIKEGVLTEFLQTVDADVTMKQIQKKVGPITYQVKQEPKGSKQIIVEVGIDDWDRFEVMLDMMTKFGWYPSSFYDMLMYKFDLDKVYRVMEAGRLVVVIFEATHDVKMQTPRFLYHITSQIYTDSIERKGLTPKTHSKLGDHPGRIYLLGPPIGPFGQLDQNVLKGFAVSLYRTTKPEVKSKIREMVVYKIDTNKVPKLELRDDPNFAVQGASGYYTYNNIPPSAITKEHVFDLYTI